MKKLLAFAVLSLISLPAHADNGVSIEINGRTVHIGVPKDCDGDQCISITTRRNRSDDSDPSDDRPIDGRRIGGFLSDLIKKRLRSQESDDEDVAPPAADRTEPAPRPWIPPAPATTPIKPPSPVAAIPPRITTPAVAPAPAAPVRPAAPSPAPAQVAQPWSEAPKPVAAVPATAVAPPPAAATPAPTPMPSAQEAASPVGTWLTQNKEGRVHIVPCGANLCGYVVDGPADAVGVQVLDMKPIDDNSWGGHVRDPKGGGIYDAKIALKGPDALAIRGCAFGGLICRGQTWRRV